MTLPSKPIEKWTARDFIVYLHERHLEVYGIDYVANNIDMEARSLKTMIGNYGAAIVRDFIDACFAHKKPTAQWPGCNFGFMFSYMRDRHLPPLLVKQKTAEQSEEDDQRAAAQSQINYGELF
ncbi:hypothetical protein IHP72_15265 [Bacillus pumilus]|uniref:hypothetical protein n=1 Tax=Bacillus pumilus TaxID=1408 RepID=UPI001B3A36BF|nr:hypothetical protein [Bacillus pumilus]MBQ4817613.1 hypothetical protein [Bacillus pumilus]